MAKLINSGQKTMQPKSRANVRFILHQPGVRSTHGVLYVRVTVDGLRAPERSTGIRVLPGEWDSKKQAVKGKSTEAGLINSRIAQLRTRFLEAQDHLTLSRETITSRKLAALAMGEGAADKYTFQEIYERFVREKELTSDNSKRTFQVYAKYFTNISRYLEESGQKGLLITDIDDRVFLGLIEYMKARFKEDYAAKISGFFRSVYTYAFNKGLVSKNPLASIRLGKSGLYDLTHLSQDEVKQLAAYDFSTLPLPDDTIRVLDEERDALVFSCFTGLHHSDYVEKRYRITEYNGSKWIEGHRVKSKGGRQDKPYQMKLHPLALAIIDKYQGIDKLPKRNNYKRNLILKQIAAYVGINKHLTTKIGRKTLTNYCINVLGISHEATAEILGHRSTNFIKHYGKLDKSRLDKDIQFDQEDL
ncbi:site-specific integrase [Ravibacter arvi]|uniref:site-specific integrase n=1 Tax=Ravibacter arvi TaxID=2051041 RepID=UPI0031E56BC1